MGTRTRVVLVLASVAWVVIVLSSSLKKSASIDEVPHIAAGLSALHYFDFRMNPEHPPLVKVLSVLPAYLFYRPDMHVAFGDKYVGAWADGDQNHYGYYLLFHAGKNPLRLLFFCRIVPGVIALLGGLFAFFYGRHFSRSTSGGIIAAALLLLYPEYAGHGRFITMDVATVVGCGAVSWFSFRWWRKPGWRTLSGFVLACAIGSQVKLPVTVFIGFVLATLLLLSGVRLTGKSRRSRFGHARLPQVLLLGLCAAVAVYVACWASAGFRFAYLPAGATPPAHTTFIPPFAETHNFLGALVNFFWKYRLLPETTLATLAVVRSFAAREMFLFQEMSLTGWYHYFFVTIGTKTSVFYLIAAFASVVFLVREWTRLSSMRRRMRAEQWTLFLLPFVLLFALFCHSRANIGHRHVLFVYVPLSVIIACAFARWLNRGGVPRAFVKGFFVVQAFTFLLAYPHYETYFNEFIRNAYRGHYILRDSNVDWGQDVPLAAEFLDEMGERNCNYAAFGFNRPQSYGIREFNWIVPYYPFSINMPQAKPPDPNLISIISLNTLPAVRSMYPELFQREPDVKLNSMVVFLPTRFFQQRPLHNDD